MMFKAGDKVRVKRWGEMLKDKRIRIGVENLTEEGTSYSFTREMRRFCSRAGIVLEVNEQKEIKLFLDEFGFVSFIFREWMLEDVDGVTRVYIISGDE